MKKLFALLLALTFLTAAAGAVNLYVDMNLIETDTPPTIVDGRTLVPLRAIFEAIGATVDWDASTSTATGARGDTTVIIQINNTTAYVSGEARVLDVPAQLINGRTMVPARFISEAMGCDVTWDGKTETAAVAYQLKGVGLYATPTGERYHYSASCNGGTYYETTLAEIAGRGLEPCDKCVLTNPGSMPGSAEDEYPWTTLPMPVGEVPVNVPGWTPDAAQDNTPDAADTAPAGTSGAAAAHSGSYADNSHHSDHHHDYSDTVYVSSRSSTIHSVHDCGGMKNYREMTRADADAHGYKYCPNCW